MGPNATVTAGSCRHADTAAAITPEGVRVACLSGFQAHRLETRDVIPHAEAHAFLLEYIATQAQVYERVNGHTVDADAHARAFWDNLDAYLPPKGSYYLVWSDAGRLVGTGAMRCVDGTTCEMKHLYVRPEARGTGLGRWLVEQRLRDARAMGASEVVADTLKGNVEMPALYAKLGFEEIEPNPHAASLKVMPHLVEALHFFRKAL